MKTLKQSVDELNVLIERLKEEVKELQDITNSLPLNFNPNDLK